MHATVVNARYMGRSIEGTFPIVGTPGRKTVIVAHPEFGHLQIPRTNTTIVRDGALASEPVTLSFDELVHKIRERFDVLEEIADGVVSGDIRSLIVSGKPGIGKSHALERKLEKAAGEGSVKYTQCKGVMSPVGLYIELYRNRGKGNVVLIDDTDSVFNDEEALAVLKAALDSGDHRVIAWNKASPTLANEGVPNRFTFDGVLIFITNVDLESAARGGGKLAPHVEALCSRSLFVDLGVHSHQALLARVTDVCRTTDMLTSRGLDAGGIETVLQWLTVNAANVRSLSLRTALQLAGLIKTTPDRWEKMAEATLLRR